MAKKILERGCVVYLFVTIGLKSSHVTIFVVLVSIIAVLHVHSEVFVLSCQKREDCKFFLHKYYRIASALMVTSTVVFFPNKGNLSSLPPSLRETENIVLPLTHITCH
jgi:hypothetical protein